MTVEAAFKPGDKVKYKLLYNLGFIKAEAVEVLANGYVKIKFIESRGYWYREGEQTIVNPESLFRDHF